VEDDYGYDGDAPNEGEEDITDASDRGA